MGQFLILCEMYFISLSRDPESPYQLSKKSGRSCIYVLGESFLSLSTNFSNGFWNRSDSVVLFFHFIRATALLSYFEICVNYFFLFYLCTLIDLYPDCFFP